MPTKKIFLEVDMDIKSAQEALKKLSKDFDTLEDKYLAEKSKKSLFSGMHNFGRAVERADSAFKRLLKTMLGIRVISMALSTIESMIRGYFKYNTEAFNALAEMKALLLTIASIFVNTIMPYVVKLVQALNVILKKILDIITNLLHIDLSNAVSQAEDLYYMMDKANNVAGFDELNVIGQSDVMPDFGAVTDSSKGVSDEIDKWVKAIEIIGGIILGWNLLSKASELSNIIAGMADNGFLKIAAGIGLCVGGVFELYEGIKSVVEEGMNMENISQILEGIFFIALGLTLLFGPIAGAIGLIIGACVLLGLAIYDIFQNGVNEDNLTAIAAAITLIGAAVGFLVGGPVGLVIAAIAAIIGLLVTLWAKCEWFRDGVKAVLEFIWNFIKIVAGIIWEIVSDVVSWIWDIIKGVFDFISGIVTGIWEIIKNVAGWIWDKIKGVIDSIRNGVQNFWGFVVSVFDGIWSKCSSIFGSIKSFVSGVWEGLKNGASVAMNSIFTFFQNAYTKVSGVWGALKTFFQNLWDGIKNAAKTSLNALIDTLNKAIRGVNKIITPLRSIIVAVGKMFGASWTMGSVSIPEIPRLASGTVVPPNNEFLAMLGDNKREPEIVSPVSTMKQAFLEAMSEMGNGRTEALLEELIAVVAKKELTINPSVSLGRVVSKSQQMYGRVTG